MAGHRVLTFVLGILFLSALFAMSQKQDPLVYRATTNKTVRGQVRLLGGKKRIVFRPWEKMTNYSVGLSLVDSSTATTPDAARTLAISQLGVDGFMIRSVTSSSDTVLVNYVVIGD